VEEAIEVAQQERMEDVAKNEGVAGRKAVQVKGKRRRRKVKGNAAKGKSTRTTVAAI